MATHPSLALQQAILATLRANPGLTALLGGPRIHDAVPQRAAMPYLAYGPITLRDWSTGSGPGHQHLVSISVVSREPGFLEVYALLGALVEALEGGLGALAGHRLILLQFETADVRRDPDGVTSKGVATFRALTEAVG